LFGEFSAFEQGACNLTSVATNMARGVKEGDVRFAKEHGCEGGVSGRSVEKRWNVCLQKNMEVKMELVECENF
jgi:hypothetical protein